MRDSFDVLYAEGDPRADRPKMMSIGMHCRLLGRPGRAPRCSAFSTTSGGTPTSGCAAHRHRPPLDRHPPLQGLSHVAYAGQLNRASPAEAELMLDGLYEHTPWIAARAVQARPFRSLAQLKHAMAEVLAEAGVDAQLALIRAHPELAGKAMVAGTLTAESTGEQTRAGLTACTPEELARIQQLNATTTPASASLHPGVRGPRGSGLSKQQIIDTFARRLAGHPDFERAEALRNIHRIAEIRLNDKFAAPPALGNEVWDWHEKLAQHSDPGFAEAGQLTVTYLTDAHRACAQRISHWMRDAGFDEVQSTPWATWWAATTPTPWRQDPADRQPLRHRAQRRQVRRPPGHLRAHGLRARAAPRPAPALHIEVVGFAEEEGQRYKATFLGSGALVGDFKPEWLEQNDGITLREAMQHAGLCIDDIPKLRATRRLPGLRRGAHRAGPGAQRAGPAAGHRHLHQRQRALRGRIHRQASHAGTTPMDRRRDAACAVAELALYIEQRAARTATRWPPWACCRCPTARSTWCPGAASSAWTCARPPTPSATPCRRHRGRGAPSPSAAACSASWPRPCAPAPRPARRPGKRWEAAVDAGPAGVSHAQRRRPRRHEAARGHAPGHAVRARRERRHQPQPAGIDHRRRHGAGGARHAAPAGRRGGRTNDSCPLLTTRARTTD
jgi:N-carbamoyl-L-amino-acid hydrolase